jgi:hypothetical protein
LGTISSPNEVFPLGDLSDKRYSKRGSFAKPEYPWFSLVVPAFSAT